MNQLTNGPGISGRLPEAPAREGELLVEYIGKKPRKEDRDFKTGVVWDGHGDTQPVPASIASRMCILHPDIWRLVRPGEEPSARQLDAPRRDFTNPRAAWEASQKAQAEKKAKAAAPPPPPPARTRAVAPTKPAAPPPPAPVLEEASLEEVVTAAGDLMTSEDAPNHIDEVGLPKVESIEKRLGKKVTTELRDAAMAEIASAAQDEPAAE